jgi:hypothetical protein
MYIIKLIKKLKEMSYENQLIEAEKQTVGTLDLLAIKIYNDFDFSISYDPYGLLHIILSERSTKLNDCFEWTVENKQKHLIINDKFMRVFENAYSEAQSIANGLENKINNNDDYLNSYEIDIKIKPYIIGFNEFDSNCFGYILSEPYSHYAPIDYFFGRLLHKDENPIYMDKLNTSIIINGGKI